MTLNDTRADYFCTQHYLVGFQNRDIVFTARYALGLQTDCVYCAVRTGSSDRLCLLRGTHWVFRPIYCAVRTASSDRFTARYALGLQTDSKLCENLKYAKSVMNSRIGFLLFQVTNLTSCSLLLFMFC
jgi:hypothetical protein